jgi:hypothetical protein
MFTAESVFRPSVMPCALETRPGVFHPGRTIAQQLFIRVEAHIDDADAACSRPFDGRLEP